MPASAEPIPGPEIRALLIKHHLDEHDTSAQLESCESARSEARNVSTRDVELDFFPGANGDPVPK